MADYKVFWGDSHHNTYVNDPAPWNEGKLAEACRLGAMHLDFYPMAYYTPQFNYVTYRDPADPNGGEFRFHLEGWKPTDVIEREWAEVNEVSREWNRPGEFVTFPGYEWQGNGKWGDHNVFYKTEGLPVYRVNTAAELYEKLRGKDAVATPHHIAYRLGHRSKNWSAFDEKITLFAEIFSKHGCSETDEEWIGLRRNSHMGPGTAGGTYRDALLAGLHVGAICSTDAFGTAMPGPYGNGLMACLAEELDRESLWEAFLARRVYGVTGDRILLDFTVNDSPMGSIIEATDARKIKVSCKGLDSIDRIEILRNEKVIATYCHQDTWETPPPGKAGRFKLRIEAGWGPRVNEMVQRNNDWKGRLIVPGGKIIGWSPCWLTEGQGVPRIKGETAEFSMKGIIDANYHNADVFEFETDPNSEVVVELNGETTRATAAELCEGSSIIWYRDECVAAIREASGITPADAERQDTFYHLARKAKLHRAVPEAGYSAEFEYEDDEPVAGEIFYRVRIEQRNGQRAWSSPVWVSAR